MDLAKISSNLKNFFGKCSIPRFDRVSSCFGEKTRQPTRCFRVLEAKTRRRPSSASGWLVLRSDLTGWMGELGLGFCWTPLPISVGQLLAMEYSNFLNLEQEKTILAVSTHSHSEEKKSSMVCCGRNKRKPHMYVHVQLKR